jgi:predicted outer membrane repeat protein
LGGTLTVADSVISSNSAAQGSGGGIESGGGLTLTVTGSTLSGNSAGADGGGIYNGFRAFGTLTITNSTLSGNTAGRAGSGIYNEGVFAVRGLVTIDGDYFQSALGTLRLHIGGTQAGSQYDQLVVHGLATLDGTLAVAFAKGFRPHSGDQFQVLLAGGVQGAFRQAVWNGLARFTFDYTDGLTLVAN